MLELSWESQAFTTATKSIKATIKAVGGDLNVKKLDLVGGLGSDFKGLELGIFVMPQSATDGNLPANYKGKYELRVISGIPDKNFAIETIVNGENKGYLHQFIYLPVQGPDGKLWLNNNLGADYSNINSPHFDPAKQAETPNDYKVYGSLFNYGKKSDGHELVKWSSGNEGVIVNEVLKRQTWSFANSAGWIDSPCPDGWGIPTGEVLVTVGDLNTNIAVDPNVALPFVPTYDPYQSNWYRYSQYWAMEYRLVYGQVEWGGNDYHLGNNLNQGLRGSIARLQESVRCVKK